MKSLRAKLIRTVTAVIAVSALMGLAACAPTPAVEPITVSANDLQGKTVDVPLNSMLNINTGSLAVDSYTATVEDTSIASFVQGHTDGGATFNPGFTPLEVGKTSVTMSNKNGGIQNLVFTINVTPVLGGANLGGAGR
jgi:hypothetical protein